MKIGGYDKIKGSKIGAAMSQRGTAERFGKESGTAALSRRERRNLEQAQGLVPFAVKLDADLVQRIQTRAQERKTGLNEVAAELLTKGLESK